MKDLCYMVFRVAGEGIDFQGLVELFPLEPINICVRGNAFYNEISKKLETYREDCFTIRSTYYDDTTLDAAVLDFTSRFAKHAKFIKELAAHHEVCFWLSVYPSEYASEIELSAKTLANVARVGIPLWAQSTFMGEHGARGDFRIAPDTDKSIKFSIRGEKLDIEKAINDIEIQFADVAKRGDKYYDVYTRSMKIHADNSIAFSREYSEDYSFEEMVTILAKKLSQKSTQIKEIARTADVCIAAKLYTDSHMKSVEITPKIMRACAKIGARLSLEDIFLD